MDTNEIHMTEKGIEFYNGCFPWIERKDMNGNVYVNALASAPGDEDYLILRPGMFQKESFEKRYNSNVGCIKPFKCYTMPSNNNSPIDKPFLDELKSVSKDSPDCGFEWCGDKNENDYHTEDAFKIKTYTGLKKFLAIIEGFSISEHKPKRKYDSSSIPREVWDTCYEIIKANRRYTVADLCMRWQKTNTTFIILQQLHKEKRYRIGVVVSYVGNCKKSYSDRCGEGNTFENVMFIDPDDFNRDQVEITKRINEHLDANSENEVIFYVKNTGDDELFDERIKALKNFKNQYCLILEETDFGSHCDNQIKKTKKLDKDTDFTIIMSGTGTYKLIKALNGLDKDAEVYYATRDYLLDVLPNRPNAVGIRWSSIDDLMTKDTGRVENWSSMHVPGYFDYTGEFAPVQVDEITGNTTAPKYAKLDIPPSTKDYLLAFFRFYLDELRREDFLDDDTFEFIKKRARCCKDDGKDVITQVWVSGNNLYMRLLCDFLNKNIGHNTLFVPINGDVTTNADSEKFVETKRRTARILDKRLVLICNRMAQRSFTCKYAKNQVLMYDGAPNLDSLYTTKQKVGRSFSEWCTEHNTAFILDFRSSSGEDKLTSWISSLYVSMLQDKNKYKESDITRIITSLPPDKFSFCRNLLDGDEVFHTLSDSEVKLAFGTQTYEKALIFKCLVGIQDFVSSLSIEDKMVNQVPELSKDDMKVLPLKTKGEGKQTTKVKKPETTTPVEKETDDKPDESITYDAWQRTALYMYNNAKVFNHYQYNDNILVKEVDSIMNDSVLMQEFEHTFHIDMHVVSLICKYWEDNPQVLKLIDTKMMENA